MSIIENSAQPFDLVGWLKSHKIIRFGLVGASSTLVDILIYNVLLTMAASVYLATAVGFVVGSVNGYILNSHFVFGRDRSCRRYVKYLLVSLIGLGITELMIHYLHVELGWLSPNPAKFAAVAVVFFWNYFMSKKWAFR